ncbi:hypothetical protein D3C84_268490 [compost metagenome]|jgi:hypothetical protein
MVSSLRRSIRCLDRRTERPRPRGVFTGEYQAFLQESPAAAVPAKTPPAAVPAVPEPVHQVHQVQPAARQPSTDEVELKALKAGLVPVTELVGADPKVIEAKQALVEMETDVATAKDWVVEIPQKAAEWRAEHPWLAALHDKGLKKSPELVYCAESLNAVQNTLRHAETNLRRGRDSVDYEQRSATGRIREANGPVMARIAELESAVIREMAADGPSAAPELSHRRSTPAPRSDRDYKATGGQGRARKRDGLRGDTLSPGKCHHMFSIDQERQKRFWRCRFCLFHRDRCLSFFPIVA